VPPTDDAWITKHYPSSEAHADDGEEYVPDEPPSTIAVLIEDGDPVDTSATFDPAPDDPDFTADVRPPEHEHTDPAQVAEDEEHRRGASNSTPSPS
jgi:hypothetical protein